MDKIENCKLKAPKTCKNKSKIKKPITYCGEDLECSGINRGDNFNTVVQKLDSVACSGGGGNQQILYL